MRKVVKIFNQVKGRPLYVVDKRVVNGAEEPGAAAAPLDEAVERGPVV